MELIYCHCRYCYWTSKLGYI